MKDLPEDPAVVVAVASLLPVRLKGGNVEPVVEVVAPPAGAAVVPAAGVSSGLPNNPPPNKLPDGAAVDGVAEAVVEAGAKLPNRPPPVAGAAA